MKLNTDCIRDILLSVENITDFDTPFCYSKTDNSHELLTKYEHNEIVYHIQQCQMSNFFTKLTYYECSDTIHIDDLTPKGHDFIANIRSDKIFNKSKNVASKIGTTSLNAFIQISTGVITQLINHELGF